MAHETPKLRSDPWPWIDRLPSGWLELSFDAPLNTERRVSWLGVRDWLAANYNAKFLNAFVDPITQFWSVEVTTFESPSASVVLCSSDFPDDLILRAQDAASEWLIHDAAARLRAKRPDLGDLREMDRGSFKQWIDSLRKTAQ